MLILITLMLQVIFSSFGTASPIDIFLLVNEDGMIESGVGKIWSRERLPTSVFWPGEFHGLYSPWGRKESDTTERLSLTHSLTLNYLL